ncbi:MAG: thioredoxin family protein [Bacteroidota bacterium]|nr:thioredoxin family protein [Bacteroidota bacterium]
MKDYRRKIEVFTAGCPLCEAVIKLVNGLENCDVTIYNLYEQWNDEECINKVKEYQINSVPSVVVDGKILDYKKYFENNKLEQQIQNN